MKILIVCSKNSGCIAPFITDQVEALQGAGLICEYYTIEGKGVIGYLKNRAGLLEKIKSFQPDLIHAHYGLSGLLANTQRRVPVITTYHGSDINNPKVLRFSKIAIKLSTWNIFVSQKNIDIARVKKKYSLIPCGVDTTVFQPMDKEEARKLLGFEIDEKLILFAGAFDNQVKNAELAIEAVKQVPKACLLELKGFTRPQIAQLMNAVDLCLMTSYTEGSPQFIKEAMACNCPIVSVNVGDVEKVMEGIEACFLVERNPETIGTKMNQILVENKRTKGAAKIKHLELDSAQITQKLISVYKNIL